MQYNNELQNRVYSLAKTLDLNGLQTQYCLQKDKIQHPQTTEDLNQDQAILTVIIDLLQEKGITAKEYNPKLIQVTP